MKLNAFLLFPTTSQGMPLIEASDFVPEKLQAYRTKKKAIKERTLHFFIDDWRFENLWNFPYRYLSSLQKFDAVIGPDFSLYLDYPTPIKFWNVYRNRWLSRFWAEQGLRVIPCISWAEKDSFSYCFDGIPRNSVVAIASMGIYKKDRKSTSIFLEGVEAMIDRLAPIKVLVYGEKMRRELEAIANIFRFYPYYMRGDEK